MDKTRFLLSCQKVMGEERKDRGIGTLGEKTLHAVLKTYFDPGGEHQEIPMGPYVADICNNEGFFEIQTQGFHRLRDKLAFFLKKAPVTVIYPVPAVKWLIWLDQDGSAASRRKSPKRAGPFEILPELYKIKPLLNKEGLFFCIVLVELEEYRLKNGWSQDGKRGSTRFERLPINLLDEIWIRGPADYRKLIPELLPEEFTVKEFAKAAGLSVNKASVAVNVLFSVNALQRTGKIKNAYLYRRTEANEKEKR